MGNRAARWAFLYSEETGKVVELVNNKLIRNGSRIAMDERLDGQGLGKKRRKKSQSRSSGL